jgi:hypothetical protein
MVPKQENNGDPTAHAASLPFDPWPLTSGYWNAIRQPVQQANYLTWEKKSCVQSTHTLSYCCLYLSTRCTSRQGRKRRMNALSLSFHVWCKSSLPSAFASSKYFARRHLQVQWPKIKQLDSQWASFYKQENWKRIYGLARQFVPDHPSPFLSYDAKIWLKGESGQMPFLHPHTPHVQRRHRERLKLLERNFAVCSSAKNSYKNRSGRHIFKQQMPLSPKQIPFFKGFQTMTLRTCLGACVEHFSDYANLTHPYIRTFCMLHYLGQ